MFHLIRNELMTQDDEPLTGAGERGEKCVRGKLRPSIRAKLASKQFTTARGTEARNAANAKKTPVFGAVVRGHSCLICEFARTRVPILQTWAATSRDSPRLRHRSV